MKEIPIAKGTTIYIGIRASNLDKRTWGEDALEFKPERWLNGDSGINGKAKDIQGYHHILSFIDGPRMCLGRAFATAEFKVSLAKLFLVNLFLNLILSPQVRT